VGLTRKTQLRSKMALLIVNRWHPCCLNGEQRQMASVEPPRKAGRQCAAPAIRGGTCCAAHAYPERAAELGRKGGARNLKVYVDAEQEVSAPTSIGEVKKMLAETMAGVRSGRIDPKIGTTVAYVAAALLRAYEADPPALLRGPASTERCSSAPLEAKKNLATSSLTSTPGCP
jgi:hypothetical protein